MNRPIFFLLCSFLLLSLVVVQAPSLLIVSEDPVKSDAVVLFLGGEKGTREKEARQLMQEGLADYLIIPARNQVQKRNAEGKLIKIDLDLKLDHLKLNTPQSGSLKLKTASWLEDTHQEALIARNTMERLGIRSAILVSAPYHMRRIKLIAGQVFGDGMTVCYVPTRYDPPNDGFWLFNGRDRKFVMTEYAKIAWFLIYNPFV